MATYSQALYHYNLGKPQYCMPKKGTAQYREVLAIKERMEKLKRKAEGRLPKAKIKSNRTD